MNLARTCKTLRWILLNSSGWKSVTFPRAASILKTTNLRTMVVSMLAWMPWIGPKVTRLDLNGTKLAFGDADLSLCVRNTPNLSFLDVTGSAVTQKGIHYLLASQACLGLSTLIMVNIHGLDNTTLNYFGGGSYKYITKLDVSVFAMEGKFTDDGFESVIRGCPALETLRCIGSHELSDHTLLLLASHATHLRSLDISGAFLVTDRGIHTLLKQSVALKQACFSYCWRITDEAFENIVSSGLEYLSVSFCYQLTDRVLGLWSRHFQHLKHINVDYCSNISSEAREQMQKQRDITWMQE